MFDRLPRRRTLAMVWLTALALILGAFPAAAKPSGTVNVQVLALNDFHGQISPVPSTSSGGRVGNTAAGGAEYLATHLANLEATNPNTITVAAGDLIGASPLNSALFHDEPTIESLTAAGLDLSAVGNHEFDEGTVELARMQNGGCHPLDGCQDGDGFAGAGFTYLSANVVSEANGKTLFPAYKIRSFEGAKVAFIGMTLEGTPNIVTPSGVAGYDFLDEVATVNALVPILQGKGVHSIVVLLHEGGAQSVAANETTIDTCTGLSGAIVDIVNNLDEEVDLVISGHTHLPYVCPTQFDIPLTSAFSTGRVITDIDMTIDRATDQPTAMTIDNKIVTRDVALDPTQTAIVNKYTALAAPLANRVIGEISADILRAQNTAGESALGDVIADAQLDATDDPGFGDSVIAFINPGGIRTDLVYAQISGGELPGQVTYGEAFNVHPFGNTLVALTMTGAQIEIMLEQQFAGCTLGTSRILGPSAGFTYTWDAAGGVCAKVDPSSIKLNGVTIDPTAEYRVTVNSFLADGGDSFPIFLQTTEKLGGAVDLDALEAYLTGNSPVPPGPKDRITRLN